MNIEEEKLSSLQNFFDAITALAVFIPQERIITSVILLCQQINPVISCMIRGVVDGEDFSPITLSPSRNQMIGFFEKFGIITGESEAMQNSTLRALYRDILFGAPDNEIIEKHNISKKSLKKVKIWKEQMVTEFLVGMKKEIEENLDNILIGDIVRDGVDYAKSSILSVMNLDLRMYIGSKGCENLKKLKDQITLEGV